MDKLLSFRNLRNFLIGTGLLVVITSCGGEGSALLPQSTGKTGDLLIIMDTANWNSKAGDSLRYCFAKPQPGLPQNEPYFDIIHIPPQAFKTIFQITSTILEIDINKKNRRAILKKKDVWAKNQLYVKITAANREELANYVGENAVALRVLFREAQLDKIRQTVIKTGSDKNIAEVKEVAAIHLDVPSDFQKVIKETQAIYFRRDLTVGPHSVIQGILIYSAPYTHDSDLTVSTAVQRRNAVTKALVKGSTKEIFMSVQEQYEPDSLNIKHREQFVKEMRGLWTMKGAFMGGPFVNWAMVDSAGGRIVYVDGFVYGPRFDKRNYLMDLEAIIRTTRMP